MKLFRKGFTLLEVLITLAVFSIGLLGLAGLQIKSLKLAHDSFSRTIAAILSEEMADRIRANRALARKGINSFYNNPNRNQLGNPRCLGKNNLGFFLNSSCTPEEMALHDFYEWYGRINGRLATSWHPEQHAQLPSAAAVVCIDSTPNDGVPGDPQCDNVLIDPNLPIYTIKIWWIERKKDSNQNVTLHSHISTVAI